MNNKDLLSQIQQRHHDVQIKYTYFLLTASGAAIGYSIEKAYDEPLNGQLFFFFIAILFWSLSFFYGCKTLKKIQALLSANHTLISLAVGNHENQPTTAEEFEAANKGTKNALYINNQEAAKCDRYQFRLFVTGGGVFMIWRILGIFFKTVS